MTTPQVLILNAFPGTTTRRLCQRVVRSAPSGTIHGSRYVLYDLRGERVKAQTVTCRHSHLGYEVFFLLDGHMVLQTDAGEIALDAGNLLIIPAQLRHATYRVDESCLSITLRFQMDPPLHLDSTLHLPDAPAIYADLYGLFYEADAMRPGWQERVQFRMATLLSSLLAMLDSPMPVIVSEPPTTNFTDRVDEYLRQHFTRPLTLADIADAFGISVRSLIRRFRDESGETVIDRLQTLRLDFATTLLGERPDLTVKQIAAMVGMPDNAYFTNWFHRRMGMTPKCYQAHARSLRTPE